MSNIDGNIFNGTPLERAKRWTAERNAALKSGDSITATSRKTHEKTLWNLAEQAEQQGRNGEVDQILALIEALS